jgi:tetratricopeptide (TPR) repeat protein
MDLQERLTHLENVRDWQGLADELEKGIQSGSSNAVKAAFHLQLGRVLESKFLSGVKALKHFQDAYKLNPALVESLAAARGIYWALGKLNMVQKLLELELKASPDGAPASALLLELADVLYDAGDYDRATQTYAKSLAASGGTNAEAAACLEDVQVGEATWQEHVANLLRLAHDATGAARGRLFLRASRVARRFAPADAEGILAQAYAANPFDRQAAWLFEGMFVESGALATLDAQQVEIVAGLPPEAQAKAALVFGTRWATRHQNAELGSRWLEEAVRLDPENEGAFQFLTDLHGRKAGDWQRVVTLAEEAATKAGTNGNATFLLAQAASLAWRQLGNLVRARASFVRLSAVAPDHPELRAFEAQIGENLASGGPPAAVNGTTSTPPTDAGYDNDGDDALAPPSSLFNSVRNPPMQEAQPAATAPGPEMPAAPAPPAAAAAPEPTPAPAPAAPPAAAPPAAAPPAAAPPAASSSPTEVVDPAKIAELRSLAEKQEASKRFNEYVKTVLLLAAAVPDAAEKVSLYITAADLYVTKFANQAEAVKAYEQVLAIDPDQPQAVDYLRQMYEKRRDWEKLLGLQRREAERLGQGPVRAAKFLEMAKLATERVKKPEVCIDLWREVLESDPSNAEALGALGALYERAKDFEALASVLERQAEVTYDSAAKIQVLTKLGTIYGDRLNNDEGAVSAWRNLLLLDPNDRKAQEALKKKYLALGLWDDLELFYAESAKWDELIRVLEQQETKETRSDAKVSLLFKIAQLWADKKQKSDRAAKAYEKVLELDATSLRAAEALIPIYAAANNSRALASAIEVKLGHETDPDVKLGLYREVAALYEGKVKEPEKAFDRYLAAFELVPSDPQTAADVERAAHVTGAWDRVIAGYRHAIDASLSEGQHELSITLRLQLGRVLVDEVKRIDEALETYRAVYEAEDDNAQALAALERLYRQTGRFADLLGVFEKRRDLATDVEDKKAIQYEIASLYETEIRDVARAIDTYRAVLEEEPSAPRALAALDILYAQTQQWESFVETLRSRIDIENEEAPLVDLKFRLGRALEQHLDDPAGALESYREILFVQPEHEGARLALEAFLTNTSLRAEAAAILESIYEERQDYPKLIAALEILSDSESDPAKRVQRKRKIARISAEATGDFAGAFAALAAALKEDPAMLETRAEIERVAEASSAQAKLVALYDEIAGGLTDFVLARDYWMRRAAIDERMGNIDAAAQGYAQVLVLDAADAEALGALEQLFTRTERWSDLIGVFERRLEQTNDPEQREKLLGQMAETYDQRLGRPDDAVASYQKVLEVDPSSLSALTALDAIFTRQAAWPRLAENLESQLALADTEEGQLGLMLRLAMLRETEMSQVDEAIEGYRQILERDPGHAAALERLERLGAQPKYELAIADMLEPLYRQLGDHAKLIGAHEVQVRCAETVERRVELLHQIAALYEDAAGDVHAAFATLARALSEDPTGEATQSGLDRIARATGRFEDLAKTFQDLASKQTDPAIASQLYTTSARVYELDLGNLPVATSLYQRVLEIDPANLGAAEALEAVYRGTNKYPELSHILQRKSEIVETIEAKKEALFQAAAIEEDVLEQPEAAILVYHRVLELDSDDLRAIDALIKRYLGLSRWVDLLAVYARKADLVVDTDEKKRIYYQVGAVYERELGDVPRAIDTYEKILELDPDDLQALSRLDVLYEQAQNWSELLSVLLRESEMTDDPSEGVSFQYRIADLYEKRLDDVPRAIELYRDLLQVQADHEPTRAALEGLAQGSKDAVAAAAVLEPVYETASDWPNLIHIHEIQVKHATDPYQQTELLHRIARLYEDALDDHASAFATFARAIAIDSSQEDTLTNLERLASALGRWQDVAKLYDQELDKLGDNPSRFVELGYRAAQIFEVQLDDIDSAITRYRRIVAVDPENQVAIRALDRLLLQAGRWPDLAEILTREAEIGQSTEEVIELRYRLGQVYQVHLADLDGAILAYRDVLAASTEHKPTLEALEGLFASSPKQLDIAEILEPIYRQAGEFEKLAAVYEAQLAHTTGEAERLQRYYTIAELQEDKLLDPVATLATYLRAMKEYPLDEKTGEEAPRLAGSVDSGWETLANAYADILGAHNDKAVQGPIGRRLAKTFEDELGDVTKAEETYQYVLSIDPLDLDALTNLDRIYSSVEAWKELAQILEMRLKAAESQRALGSPMDALDLVELHARLGEVYEARLGQLDDALRVYRVIFDHLDRAHEPTINALARIYEERSAWQELNLVFERMLENASGNTAEADIQAKIAHLAAERLSQPGRAIETWKLVLDLRGEDAEALAAMANLYDASGAWPELVDILERQVDIAASDDDRVNIIARRARIMSDKLQRDDQSAQDWNRILDIDYGNLGALRAIADIRRRQGDPNELVSALHQIVDRAASLLEADELKEVFRELGKTYTVQLQQLADAADAWRKLLEIGPDFEAMDALEAIYRSEERWTDVIDVKMMRASALTDVQEQIAEYRSAAALWREPVGEVDLATGAWQKILDLDPLNDEAFTELEALHTAAGRWEPLIELLLGRLGTREETADKTLLLRKIARVFEEEVDDREQALEALINALEEDFHDRETARYLEKIAQSTGKWNVVIERVVGWLKAQTDPAQKIRLCLHLAKWYGEDLGHPEYAQPYYAQIVQLDPNNVGALRQMGQLYRKSANWQQLGATLTRALEVAITDLDRKEILTELGELLDSQMSQTDQALTYFQRALDVDAAFLPALENLERIYMARGQNRELADILTRKVPALSDSAEIASTKLRIATLAESSLSDPTRAAQVYREVLEVDPASLLAMRGLSRIYEAMQQWPELVRILESELDVAPTERERIDLLLQIARLQEEHFLKPDIAAMRLEQVLEIDPNHEPALFALERNYRKLRQWSELINAYERHVSTTLDRKVKVDLYAAIAQVYADELEDADRAIDAYRNIVDIDEQNVPALEALAKLYDKQGEAQQSIDAMTRVAELTQDPKQRVEAFYKIGKALDEKLGDRASAQDRYEMALDLDPSHIATIQALRVIAIDAADYDKAARYFDQEQSYTTAPRQRARLLVELGKLRDEMLGDRESALLSWEAAHEADPENEDAALPLSTEYINAQKFEQAEPLLDLLVRKSGKRERSEQHDLQNKLGAVCAALGKDEKALKAYTAASQLDLTDQVTIKGLAEVCFRLKDWSLALTNFQKVLTALDESETEARANVYYKLGCIKREQGQAKQAINNFEKALGVDPAHRPTLEALVLLYNDLKDWKQVVAYKRQILDNIVDGEERFKVLSEIGDVWQDLDKNPLKAIEALEEALELFPTKLTLLHKLLALYQATENWSKMIDTISAIADTEKDPTRKSKFLYTMAQLYRDKEGNQDRAVELFNEALDLNPTFLEAFERINKILTAQKDWKQLERAFRKMLRRLSAAGTQNPDLEYNLWHNLGLIYRDRLKEMGNAIEAFKMATRYRQEEAVERQILAELYESTDQIEAAIGEHATVLQQDPLRVDPYRSLYKLYLRTQEYDRAWCMCAALAFLHKADEEENKYFEDYRPRGMIQVKSRLDNEQWVKNLFHKDENIFIGKIFEMVTPAAIVAKTNQLRAARQLPALDKRFKQDPATSTVTFAKTFGWAAQVLGIQQLPDLYVRNDVPGALVAVPAVPPSSVAGQSVLTGFTPQELTFIVGKHLSYYRGEHYIRNLFPTLAELKVVLFSAIKIILNDFAVPPEMAQAVTATATELVKYMQPIQRDSLRLVVQKFVEDGAKADLKRWMQAIDITACRAGLLLCSELEIAKKVIGAEPQLPGDLPPAEKLKELIVFSVSDQYAALRKALGIAVGQ